MLARCSLIRCSPPLLCHTVARQAAGGVFTRRAPVYGVCALDPVKRRAYSNGSNSAPEEVPLKWPGSFKELYSMARAQAAFYWHATKTVYGEWKEARGIRRRAKEQGGISKRDKRVLIRSRGDVRKAVPLVLVITIVPFTNYLVPLIAAYFPHWLPAPFMQRWQKEKLAQTVGEGPARSIVDELFFGGVSDKGEVWKVPVEMNGNFVLGRSAHRKLSSVCDIQFNSISDLPDHIIGNLCDIYGVKKAMRAAKSATRLKQRLTDVRVYDLLLDGDPDVSDSEVVEACMARGLWYKQKNSSGEEEMLSIGQLRFLLSQWLEISRQHVNPSLLLLYPPLNLGNPNVTIPERHDRGFACS